MALTGAKPTLVFGSSVFSCRADSLVVNFVLGNLGPSLLADPRGNMTTASLLCASDASFWLAVLSATTCFLGLVLGVVFATLRVEPDIV